MVGSMPEGGRMRRPGGERCVTNVICEHKINLVYTKRSKRWSYLALDAMVVNGERSDVDLRDKGREVGDIRPSGGGHGRDHDGLTVAEDICVVAVDAVVVAKNAVTQT